MKKLLLLAITACLMACSSPPTVPTPFETGATVTAPQGCVQLRKENSKADC